MSGRAALAALVAAVLANGGCLAEDAKAPVAASGPAQPRFPPVPPSAPPSAALAAWLTAHAVPLPSEDAPISVDEASAYHRLFAGARVIALGEPGHGNHEPLAYRNRLLRDLVEHEGLTALAMETGLAETRRLAAYVDGGPGDPAQLVHDFFGWNFNVFASNVELLRWLRAWNDAHPTAEVRLYGIDVTGGYGEARMDRARFALDDTLAFLARAAPAASAPVRAELAPLAGRFSDALYPRYSPEEKARLSAALADALALFATKRAAMVAASSPRQVDIAEQEALDCQTLEHMFRVWPDDAVKVRPAPGDFEVVRIRDRAMADHLTWTLDQEGPAGKVMLFMADGHVRATPYEIPGWSSREAGEIPRSTGQYLRARLGPTYRVVMSTSSLGLPPTDARIGAISRALADGERPRLLIDTRDPPPDLAGTRTSLTDHNQPAYSEVVLGETFDALVYFDRLTPEPKPPGL